jgi:hypothetical protein
VGKQLRPILIKRKLPLPARMMIIMEAPHPIQKERVRRVTAQVILIIQALQIQQLIQLGLRIPQPVQPLIEVLRRHLLQVQQLTKVLLQLELAEDDKQ